MCSASTVFSVSASTVLFPASAGKAKAGMVHLLEDEHRLRR